MATNPTPQRPRWRDRIFGAPRDPLAPDARHGIALIAFFAWIGLGADGLSSSLRSRRILPRARAHTHFALYLALATAVTVFIISLAYNQVIELFPNGGGGYKVATQLDRSVRRSRRRASALIVDYVLTIAISIASGVGRALQPAARRRATCTDARAESR